MVPVGLMQSVHIDPLLITFLPTCSAQIPKHCVPHSFCLMWTERYKNRHCIFIHTLWILVPSLGDIRWFKSVQLFCALLWIFCTSAKRVNAGKSVFVYSAMLFVH